jgi:hypothetical protein
VAEPNDAPSLPPGVSVSLADSACLLSSNLADLLVVARQGYDWPAGSGAGVSQGRIIDLERSVEASIADLAPAAAHQILIDISEWAGNNADSHAQIVAATAAEQEKMQDAIHDLLRPGGVETGITKLCALPGISLVIASKIYRFCSPATGAAVDRHASYFFNSLPISGGAFCTSFKREWANGRHSGSRLAIYSASRLSRNLEEYLNEYVPLLRKICSALNMLGLQYKCAASGILKDWNPADVEMAAYYWWACNGAR